MYSGSADVARRCQFMAWHKIEHHALGAKRVVVGPAGGHQPTGGAAAAGEVATGPVPPPLSRVVDATCCVSLGGRSYELGTPQTHFKNEGLGTTKLA